MKIVHVAESFAGGVLDFLVDLINSMSSDEHIIIYAQREHTPKKFKHLFPPETQFILWEDATREINPQKDFLALKKLIKYLKRNSDADAIHLHSSKAGFLGRIASRFLGLQNRVIYTPHGVSFLRKDVSSIKHKLFVTLEKIGFWYGGKIVACSHSEASAFKSFGMDAHYINNGVQCTVGHNTNQKSDNQTIKIATIGRITYQKNPKLFNEIAQYFEKDTNIKFIWIGGQGELEDELSSPNIIKTGWICREKVNEMLSETDIYLSTSLWEGLPLSVLQAMCHAKPLILSDCVGNNDLVKDSENGYRFFKKEDALKMLNKLIKNQNKRIQMGENSLKIVQQEFSIEQMVNEYRLLYKQE